MNIPDVVRCSSFWKFPEAKEYQNISGQLLPSDIPAYGVAYGLLSPENKKILDSGCFNGDSSARIRNLGATSVTGIDLNPDFIDIAKRRYKEQRGLRFYTSKFGEEIPTCDNGLYDGASSTFVHPTINSRVALQDYFSRIGRVLSNRAPLILLGLHPNSLKQEYIFNYYKHGPPLSGSYVDGSPFPNKLLKLGGEVIEFYDYCWTQETIGEYLKNAGFSFVETFDLYYELGGNAGEVLRNFIDQLKQTHKMDFSNTNEFHAPLYQIIVGIK